MNNQGLKSSPLRRHEARTYIYPEGQSPSAVAMKTVLKTGTVDIPDKVKVEIVSRVVTVTGPRGKVTKNLKHLPIEMTFKDEKTIKIDRWFTYGKQAACIRTACSHINNMIIGVTKGFEYKMRFVYAHFPINVAITNKDTRVEIRNFLGERVRTLSLRAAPSPRFRSRCKAVLTSWNCKMLAAVMLGLFLTCVFLACCSCFVRLFGWSTVCRA